jgi:hypothetical protein
LRVTGASARAWLNVSSAKIAKNRLDSGSGSMFCHTRARVRGSALADTTDRKQQVSVPIPRCWHAQDEPTCCCVATPDGFRTDHVEHQGASMLAGKSAAMSRSAPLPRSCDGERTENRIERERERESEREKKERESARARKREQESKREDGERDNQGLHLTAFAPKVPTAQLSRGSVVLNVGSD